jgi:hypothetical protein
MNVIRKAVAVAVGTVVGAVCFVAPAGADPADDPCQLAGAFLCGFMFIAPTLDHDVDLTEDPATINGTPLPQLPSPTPAPQAPPDA